MPPLPAIEALGTRWWIEIFDEISEAQRAAILDGCALLLTEFEERYSRFRADSLISILNTTRTIDQPDAALIDLLEYGVGLFDRSHGGFNLMIGAKLVASGYDSTYSFVAREHMVVIPSPHDALAITKEKISLHTGQIDIGGFGKGYVIDILANYLHTEHGLSYFLINGGGDMYGTSEFGRPIMIYLEHPTEPNQYIETTTILDQGFAASSPHKRTWTSAGKTYTHIVSSTDAPLTADATFIKAATARDADAFATVALLLTPDAFAPITEAAKLGIARFTVHTSTLVRNTAFN